jgi:hypothetical protein
MTFGMDPYRVNLNTLSCKDQALWIQFWSDISLIRLKKVLRFPAEIRQPTFSSAAFITVGSAFLRCGGASPPVTARSRKTHAAHRRIKIERVYRPYLTALEAAFLKIRLVEPHSTMTQVIGRRLDDSFDNIFSRHWFQNRVITVFIIWPIETAIHGLP